MAAKVHGNLGSVAPAAATDTNLYDAGGAGVVPAGRKATGTLTITNTGVATSVRFAIVHGPLNTVTKKDYREYDTPLAAAGEGGVIEKTGIPLKAGARLLVRAGTADVAFNFDGIEEDA